MALKDKWVAWRDTEPSPFSKSDLDGFSTGQKIEFLALLQLEGPLSHKKLETMASTYGLNEVKNAEIRCKWIRLGLKGEWKEAIPNAVQMVTEQGRMKFLRPIYR